MESKACLGVSTGQSSSQNRVYDSDWSFIDEVSSNSEQTTMISLNFSEMWCHFAHHVPEFVLDRSRT